MENSAIGPNDLCIFIDESGDLGKFGSACFTIAALATRDFLKLGRIIKRVRQRKLKKKFRKLSEIKANNSNESIRKFVLGQIGSCNCDISAIVIPKSKVREYLFSHKEKLYNYLCGLFFAHISLDVGKVFIVIDKKDSNRLLRLISTTILSPG